MIDPAQLVARVNAAGGAEALFDAGIEAAIACGYVESRREGMIRLLPAGRETMRQAAQRAGVEIDDADPDPDAIGVATTLWLLELTESAAP